jgi:hypothetical protein
MENSRRLQLVAENVVARDRDFGQESGELAMNRRDCPRRRQIPSLRLAGGVSVSAVD